ncbi:putative phosphoribosyltransferase [Pseudomonas duriflava]|uniref:Putative phosphoribosyltransferase n=1 Tax=Pseudomonas duriflava TaxID=459528 RepID=A0A562QIU5_9PSED|nr:phosphoribosyltransferase family protein [Pseudomonas duriflava]TWI56664.1 putative phosphoribosyltransferase [Pseudomonas duriflava]
MGAVRKMIEPYQDRFQAGQALAEVLQVYANASPVVLALPRGGVPVALPIAQALNAPLDVVMARKIGAPNDKGCGLGAVIDGPASRWVVNQDRLEFLNPPAGWFEAERDRQLSDLKGLRRLYCGNRPPVSLKGRTVILADDGLDTGGTARVALMALAEEAPARLMLAVPVGARRVVNALQKLADQIICLAMPEPFQGIGAYYRQFEPLSDVDVAGLLSYARHTRTLGRFAHPEPVACLAH